MILLSVCDILREFLFFNMSCAVSLEDSLWFLHRYIKEAAEQEERLDQILVPMMEHVWQFDSPLFFYIIHWNCGEL